MTQINSMVWSLAKSQTSWRDLGNITMNKASRGNSSWALSNPKRWCCESVSKFGKRSSGHRTGKGHFSFQSHSYPKEGNAKECSNYRTIALISHTSKVMLKILQAWLQQYVKGELPVVQASFRKGRGTRNQTANIRWITEKTKRVPEKHLLLLYWLCQSFWLCGSQQTVENLL